MKRILPILMLIFTLAACNNVCNNVSRYKVTITYANKETKVFYLPYTGSSCYLLRDHTLTWYTGDYTTNSISVPYDAEITVETVNETN